MMGRRFLVDFAWPLLAVVGAAVTMPAGAAGPGSWTGPARRIDAAGTVRFDLPAAPLVRSLELFGTQSGLQVVYASTTIGRLDGREVRATTTPPRALDMLLEGTGLGWATVGKYSVVILPTQFVAHARVPPERPPAPRPPPPPLEEVLVLADPVSGPGRQESGFSTGFIKPLIETPRAISMLDDKAIDRLGPLADDLASVVPAAHTTSRFGISGATDVRNVPADVYFRGMKRLTLRGHARKVSAAMDRIELVGGPAPPIYGMGKLGGYVNVEPKSGRAAEGAWRDEHTGFAQLVAGSYDKRDVSFGIGGPLSFLSAGDRRGGYYVYGMVEDSGSFADHVPVEQRLLQVSASIEDFAGPFRLETGAFVQKARTAGALVARLTQGVVDDGTYVRGSPLVDLDADGSGAISFREMYARSPIAGQPSAGNHPLMQAFAWPLDESGRPLPIGQFPKQSGIPQTLYDYLDAHPEADPTGALRAAGVGGPVPMSGSIPAGMLLDPRTTGLDTLDLHRAAAFEADLDAQFLTAWFDLVSDDDPSLTIRNQLFFDGMRHYKKSYQPFAQSQDAWVAEERLTVTRRLGGMPQWMRARVLVALNLRHTRSAGRNSGLGDFANTRTDAMAPGWRSRPGGMTPNTTFVNPLDNDDVDADGYPWARNYTSSFTERGAGMMLDLDAWRRVNLIAGLRWDDTTARNVDHPLRAGDAAEAASAHRGAASWSASVSFELAPRIRPYVTFGRSSLMLDGDDNSLSNEIIRAGHVGQGELREAGIKASLFDRRLSFAGAVFRQRRVDVTPESDRVLASAYATATVTRGWSAEIAWAPRRGIDVAAHASVQSTVYEPNLGGAQLVDAATLGFVDVLGPDGSVLYPAEAFLYGGRAWLILPDGVEAYAKQRGNPDVMLGASATFTFAHGMGATAGVNHLSRTCSGRLCTVVLPSATPVRIGAFVERPSWSARVDVYNLFDERMFRARTDDALGNTMARALPGRSLYVTLKRSF